MKVVLSTPGKFHTFDLARELHARGMLEAVFTAYPRFKLRQEGIPQKLIHTFPWFHTPYMAFPGRKFLSKDLIRTWEYVDKYMLDKHVQTSLEACDVFVGLSGSALLSGRAAQQQGAHYVCDRGSAHIRVQDELLQHEHILWGIPFKGIDPRIIALEEEEYQQADCITVPSRFAEHSFLQNGLSAEKIRRLPYGVNLSRFYPASTPTKVEFNILFVGGMHLQKGIPYLLQAYQRLQHPQKSLSFAGAISDVLIARMKKLKIWPDDVRVLGHVPQPELKNLMSRSHVLVLPSIQDGFGMVMAQSMACACPVIGSTNTGAEDLFDEGREGFIVPIRNSDALAYRLQQLADDPQLRDAMGQAALERVKGLNGWHAYGDQAVAIYRNLKEKPVV